MEKLKKILEREIAQRELALKHNPLNKVEIKEELAELQEGLVKLFAMPVVVGSALTKVEKRELLENEFYCSKCDTIHTKTAYAIAQRAMNVDLIFTCTCGNKIDL